MDNKVRPTALLILDGYGIGAQNAGNAIWAAKTPVMDKLLACCPHTQLSASGAKPLRRCELLGVISLLSPG